MHRLLQLARQTALGALHRHGLGNVVDDTGEHDSRHHQRHKTEMSVQHWPENDYKTWVGYTGGVQSGFFS